MQLYNSCCNATQCNTLHTHTHTPVSSPLASSFRPSASQWGAAALSTSVAASAAADGHVSALRSRARVAQMALEGAKGSLGTDRRLDAALAKVLKLLSAAKEGGGG